MRLSKDEYFMRMAHNAALRSTCIRRSVGCVLVNSRGHVLATGYNGVASGLPHCNARYESPISPGPKWYYPNACSGSGSASGTNLDGCDAIHAEQNALLQCQNVHDIVAAYTTTPPCVTCTKLLLNTGCQRIVCSGDYPSSGEFRWRNAGREWVKFVGTLGPVDGGLATNASDIFDGDTGD